VFVRPPNKINCDWKGSNESDAPRSLCKNDGTSSNSVAIRMFSSALTVILYQSCNDFLLNPPNKYIAPSYANIAAHCLADGTFSILTAMGSSVSVKYDTCQKSGVVPCRRCWRYLLASNTTTLFVALPFSSAPPKIINLSSKTTIE
jgi:hypothetical protein